MIVNILKSEMAVARISQDPPSTTGDQITLWGEPQNPKRNRGTGPEDRRGSDHIRLQENMGIDAQLRDACERQDSQADHVEKQPFAPICMSQEKK